MIDDKELSTRFTYRSPVDNQPHIYKEIREMAGILAKFIVTHTPECREQSIAITKLEELVFWANAAIARRS